MLRRVVHGRLAPARLDARGAVQRRPGAREPYAAGVLDGVRVPRRVPGRPRPRPAALAGDRPQLPGGPLSSMRRAALPLFAATGGMVGSPRCCTWS
jgi:hypothetical protein